MFHFDNKFEKSEYNLTRKCHSQWSVKWICFDKNEKFVYGIKLNDETIELLALHLFTRTERILKNYRRLKFIRFKNVDEFYKLHTDNAFASCSDEAQNVIGIFQINTCSKYEKFQTSNVILFYEINLTNGKMENYVIFEDDFNNENIYNDYTLMHSKTLGWIVGVKFTYYSIALDSNKKHACLQFITRTNSLGTPKLMDTRLFLFSSNSINFVHQFDFKNSTWISKSILNPNENENHSSVAHFWNSLFAVPKNGFLLQLSKDCDVWQESDIKCVLSTDADSSIILSAALGGKRSIFFNFVDKRVFPDGNRKSRSNLTFAIVTDALTLEEICLLKLVNSFSRLFDSGQEDKIAEYFDFPCSMRRKYFAPAWSTTASEVDENPLSCFISDGEPFF